MVRPTFPSASSATSNGLVRNKASKVIDFKTIEWARDALYTTYTFGDKFEYMADIEERCVLLYLGCRQKIKKIPPLLFGTGLTQKTIWQQFF